MYKWPSKKRMEQTIKKGDATQVRLQKTKDRLELALRELEEELKHVGRATPSPDTRG